MIAVLLAVVGIVMTVVGVALVYPPAALIVGGLACTAFALLADLDRKAE